MAAKIRIACLWRRGLYMKGAFKIVVPLFPFRAAGGKRKTSCRQLPCIHIFIYSGCAEYKVFT
ncbi:MAG: hypothetical protein BGP13_04115 [Sphingobacteriales bacterium 40-81]|nr:MAG: hypothetical protein BGP13_04115 [Sphingobacteriales bacterium 40-81]